MGYESAPLAIETREHPASKTSWVLADGKMRQHGSRMLRKDVIAFFFEDYMNHLESRQKYD